MRRFRGIVQNNIEPQDKEVLWLFKGTLYYFEDGWQPLKVIREDMSIFPETNYVNDDDILFILQEGCYKKISVKNLLGKYPSGDIDIYVKEEILHINSNSLEVKEEVLYTSSTSIEVKEGTLYI
jgi:hypothetical protein